MARSNDDRAVPEGIITEYYLEDVDLGLLKSGKEADVWLVERRAEDRACLLAAKRYRPAEHRAFRNDIAYRAHRRVQGWARDGTRTRARAENRALQVAMDKRTSYGRKALAQQWISTEFEMLQRLWASGATVPYPLSQQHDGILMQYVGDQEQAAPRLAQARLDRDALPGLFEQIRANLLAFGRAGVVHADLSAYNILLWEGRLWFIDVPQAVPYLANLDATEFLHRDIGNICAWFRRKGLDVDPEDLFVHALNGYFEYQMEDLYLAKD